MKHIVGKSFPSTKFSSKSPLEAVFKKKDFIYHPLYLRVVSVLIILAHKVYTKS